MSVAGKIPLSGIDDSEGAAWADIDNDGDLDLATAGKLWVNTTTQTNGNHGLKIRLGGDGTTVNRPAIGTQARVDAGNGIMTRQVEGGTGRGNQNDLTLHFGLGSHGGPVDVEVLWPNGATVLYRDVPPDDVANISMRPPRVWEQVQTIEGAAGERIGTSLGLSRSTLMVGAPGANRVSVYRYGGGTWTQDTDLAPSPMSRPFGDDIDLDGDAAAVGGLDVYLPDATTALVGSYRQDGTGARRGRVFEYTKNGGTWSLNRTLAGPDTDYAEFGWSMAGAGGLLVAGAKGEGGGGPGSVLVYEREAGEAWTLLQTLTPSDGTSQMQFGADVATDGNTIVVGSFYGTRGNPGKAYVFERLGSSWVESQILTADDGYEDDYFGTRVAVDGDWIAVGASHWGAVAHGVVILTQVAVCSTSAM